MVTRGSPVNIKYIQVFTMAIYVILSPFAMVIENEFDKQVFRKYHILRETR